MKKTTLKILMKSAILLILTGIFVSCESEGENTKEIPFTEYSLESTSCQWQNLNYDDSVYVINSSEELEDYIECTEGSYPEIDFSRNTLLLVTGASTSGIELLDAVFFQNSINRYTLKITFRLYFTAVAEEWSKKILVPKLSDKAIVTLEKQEALY